MKSSFVQQTIFHGYLYEKVLTGHDSGPALERYELVLESFAINGNMDPPPKTWIL